MNIFSSAIISTNKLIASLYIISFMFNFTKHFIQSYGSYNYRLLETPTLQLYTHWLSTALSSLFLQFKLFQMPIYLEKSKSTMINNGIPRYNLTIYMCMCISISAVSSKSVQDKWFNIQSISAVDLKLDQ